MEEEWGVLGGGGRTKSWAPVAIASAHPAERALYMYRFPPCADRRTPPHSVVRCTDSHLRRPLERRRSSFRPPLPLRSYLRFGPGLKSFPARIAPRLCSRLPPSGQPTGKSDGGGVGGAGRGRSNKIVGPSYHRFGSSSGASVVYVPIPTLRRPPNAAAFRCTLYRFPPAPTAGTPAQFSPSPASSPSAPACGPGLKSSAAPSHASHVEPALVSTERPASPRGNLMEEEWGVLGGGGRTKSWAPVTIASAHPAERALYMYRFPPCADRRTPPHSVVRCTDSHLRRPLERQRSSLRPPLPHRPHLRGGPGLKSFPAPSHLGSAFASTERLAHGEI